MNREIKFRAWDGKKFIKQQGLVEFGVCIFSGCLFCAYTDSCESPVNWKDNYILQQFTGLYDKNGKEIYEGDIVTDGVNNGFVFFNKDYAQYQVDFSPIEECPQELICNWAFVIGNIYENPDLCNT